MPVTLRPVRSLKLTAYMEAGHRLDDAVACLTFDEGEWCRVRPENRREFLRSRVEELVEQLIELLEPHTRQETRNELTARQEQTTHLEAIRTNLEAVRNAELFGFPIESIQSIGVERCGRGGEGALVRQERDGENNPIHHGS